MHDPVIMSDGHTYERSAAERLLAERADALSPLTREPLLHVMWPNHALRSLMSTYDAERLRIAAGTATLRSRKRNRGGRI